MEKERSGRIVKGYKRKATLLSLMRNDPQNLDIVNITYDLMTLNRNTENEEEIKRLEEIFKRLKKVKKTIPNVDRELDEFTHHLAEEIIKKLGLKKEQYTDENFNLKIELDKHPEINCIYIRGVLKNYYKVVDERENDRNNI